MKSDKLQEMQFIEQSLNNLIMQKNIFHMELSETESALEEVEKSGEDVFKVIGQLMIKSDKAKVKEDLQNKKKLLEIRFKSLEKQELTLTQKLEEVRDQLFKENKK